MSTEWRSYLKLYYCRIRKRKVVVMGRIKDLYSERGVESIYAPHKLRCSGNAFCGQILGQEGCPFTEELGEQSTG